MTDREIIEKYINLNNSCLGKEKKIKVMDMLYKYKEAFSLRDEIGTCPNIEVEIDVIDMSPFFIRPYPMGLNISPSILQSYINAILDCLQSRKYCEVIMDDLLLFTPSKNPHMNKLEDLLKPY